MKSGHNPISVQLENAWKGENFGTGRGGSPRLLWQIKGETPFPYEAASPARWKRYSTQSFIFDRSKITKLLQTYFMDPPDFLWNMNTEHEFWWSCFRECLLTPLLLPDWEVKLKTEWQPGWNYQSWKMSPHSRAWLWLPELENFTRELDFDLRRWMNSPDLAKTLPQPLLLFRVLSFWKLIFLFQCFVFVWFSFALPYQQLQQCWLQTYFWIYCKTLPSRCRLL